MRIAIKKGKTLDDIFVTRDDGTTEHSTFPKKGIVPHDAVHFFVEKALGLTNAFWGMVANGTPIEDIQEIAKAAGHASASRATKPEPHIIELLQAERIVECFEADMWSDPADNETFIAVINSACASSHVPAPTVSSQQIEAVRSELQALLATWKETEIGGTITLEW